MFNLKTDTIIIIQIFVILLLILLIKDKVEGFTNSNKTRENFSLTSFFSALRNYINKRNLLKTSESSETSETNKDSKISFLFSDNKSILDLKIDDLNIVKYNLNNSSNTIEGIFFNYEILKIINPGYNPENICKINNTTDFKKFIFYNGRNFDGDTYIYNNKNNYIVNNNICNNDNDTSDIPFKPYSFKIFKDIDNLKNELQREADDYNQILLFNTTHFREIIRLPVKLTPKNKYLEIPEFKYNKSSSNIIRKIFIPGNESDNRNIQITFYTTNEQNKKNKNITITNDTKTVLKNNSTIYKYYKISPETPTLEVDLANEIIGNNIKDLTLLKENINNEISDYVKSNVDVSNQQQAFLKKMSENIVNEKMTSKINELQFDLSKYSLNPV